MEFSEKQIEAVEKAGAVKRGIAKKEAESVAEKQAEKEKDMETTNGAVRKEDGIASGSEKTTTSTTTLGSRRSRKKV